MEDWLSCLVKDKAVISSTRRRRPEHASFTHQHRQHHPQMDGLFPDPNSRHSRLRHLSEPHDATEPRRNGRDAEAGETAQKRPGCLSRVPFHQDVASPSLHTGHMP